MVRVNLIDFYIPAPTAVQRQVKHHRSVRKGLNQISGLKQITQQPKHLLPLALVALIAVLIGLFINRR